MIHKQPWMKLGALVGAGGKTGDLSQREIKTIDKEEMVLWFKVKFPGEKFATRFKPDEVKEFNEERVAS